MPNAMSPITPLQLLKKGRRTKKFKAELQVLGESVNHHVKEEESTVFKIARELLTRDERNELGDDWAQARQRLDAADRPSRNGAVLKGKSPARSDSGRRQIINLGAGV